MASSPPKNKHGRKGHCVRDGVPISWVEGIPQRRGEALWDFALHNTELLTAWPCTKPSDPSPALELRRATLVNEIRAKYAAACIQTMGLEKPPVDSLDRWLLEQLAQPRKSGMDPLLVSPRIGECSQVLLRELKAEVPLRCPTRAFGHVAFEKLQSYHQSAVKWLDRLSMSSSVVELQSHVEKLGEWISENQSLARKRTHAEKCQFHKKLHELSGESGLSRRFGDAVEPLALQVIQQISTEAEQVAMQLGEPTELEELHVDIQEDAGKDSASICYSNDCITISSLHLAKLCALYEVHNPRGPRGKNEWENIFRKRLYVMLRRYVTFIGLDPTVQGQKGGNMHAALPELAFGWMKRELGVFFEAFASPLNCYFPHFFSAFPDVDSPFGSRGSFFDADFVVEGSYEVGPPYTEEVLDLMAQHLLRLLQQCGDKPLSFIIFAPDWEGCSAFIKLESPDFQAFRRPLQGSPYILAKGREHHYISGVQFFSDKGSTTDRYYVVPHGTRIYVLQNDGGAKKWPFTDSHRQALLERMQP